MAQQKRKQATTRKPPRLNSSARVMRQLAKQGLDVRRLITHPDGSVEYQLGKPSDDQTTEDLRKLL